MTRRTRHLARYRAVTASLAFGLIVAGYTTTAWLAEIAGRDGLIAVLAHRIAP